MHPVEKAVRAPLDARDLRERLATPVHAVALEGRDPPLDLLRRGRVRWPVVHFVVILAVADPQVHAADTLGPSAVAAGGGHWGALRGRHLRRRLQRRLPQDILRRVWAARRLRGAAEGLGRRSEAGPIAADLRERHGGLRGRALPPAILRPRRRRRLGVAESAPKRVARQQVGARRADETARQPRTLGDFDASQGLRTPSTGRPAVVGVAGNAELGALGYVHSTLGGLRESRELAVPLPRVVHEQRLAQDHGQEQQQGQAPSGHGRHP
mmetsp:Transcript_47381/g.138122  ORF Transcript_47381/g.138122 Transcript_47381/m.138122 type:complete len:268 (+) Transcript_47381:490-1293(+)